MAARWLQTPEVMRWWGDPKEQIDMIAEDLDEPLMRQWIVEREGCPFAYVQVYSLNAWPQIHLMHLPDGAEVIDAFIGEPAMLGRGHGSVFLRALAEKLRAEGAPVVVIDPDRENFQARRAYARAGFVEDKQGENRQGSAVVMLFS
jgi:aminoglycoside 6'-N-acetyltransferase